MIKQKKQGGVALLAVLILIISLVAATVFFFGGPGINASAGTQRKIDLAASAIFQEASAISGAMNTYVTEGVGWENIKVNDPDPMCPNCVNINLQQLPREYFVADDAWRYFISAIVADKVDATVTHDFYALVLIDLTKDVCEAINSRIGLNTVPAYNLISPVMLNLNDHRAAADAKEMMCIQDTSSSKYIFYYRMGKTPAIYS